MLERLAKQSGVYAIAGALAKVAGLVLAPILLNPAFLTVDGYGSFALLMVTAQLAVYVVGMGQATALLRFTTQDASHIRRDTLPATTLALSAGAAAVAVACFLLTAAPLTDLLTDGTAGPSVLVSLAAYVAVRSLAAIPLALLRVREEAVRYAVAVVCETLAIIVLVYVEVVGRGTGLDGLVRAYAGAAGVSLVVLALLTLRAFTWKVDFSAIRPLLKFGVPLVLVSLSGWFLNAGDRYLLRWLADTAAVAGYEWSARLAGLVNMLFVQSFQLAFTVVGLKALAAGQPGFYRRSLRHFSIWTGAAILMLSIWTPDGMRVLIALFDVDPHYLQARTLVFPLALGFGAYGIYIIVNNTLIAAGRTGVIGINVLAVALLNAVLNIVLIPRFGAMGAAVATVFSYAALAALATWVSGRDLRVDYQWRVPAVVVVLLTGLFLAGLALDDLSLWPRIAAKIGLCLVYVAAVPLLRLYSWRELRHGYRRFLDEMARLRA